MGPRGHSVHHYVFGSDAQQEEPAACVFERTRRLQAEEATENHGRLPVSVLAWGAIIAGVHGGSQTI